MQAHAGRLRRMGTLPFSSSHSHARARRIELSQGDHAHADFDDSCLDEVFKPLGAFCVFVRSLRAGAIAGRSDKKYIST